MKVLYLINSKEYSYHKGMINDFTACISGDVIDMSCGEYLHEIYYDIEEKSPDVIITFDLAGFELRTASDTLSLNRIYARMAHIIFSKKCLSDRSLKERQNLSMFTYIPNGYNIAEVMNKCPEVPNVFEFVKVSYKADTEPEHEENKVNIEKWWETFKREAML